MTEDDFNKLDVERKNILLFDCRKITERKIRFTKFELFNIDHFFVETRTSARHKFKRQMKTYSLTTLPLLYAPVIRTLDLGF